MPDLFGDIVKIGIFAPAGKLNPELFRSGMEILHRNGIAAVVPERLYTPDLDYLAAPAEQRAANLASLWKDKSVELMLPVRGGFGCAHLLPLLDWKSMRERPELPLCGYSDLTALQWAAEKYGAGRPMAVPMLGKLAEAEQSEYTAGYMRKVFGKEEYGIAPAECYGDYEIIAPGECEGLPLAGNLTVAATLPGTQYMPDTAGRILILEDVNEAPYRLDRALTVLEQSGAFGKCSGVIFGQFSGCTEDKALLYEILRRRTREVHGPVLANFAYGHTFPFASVDMHRAMMIKNKKISVSRRQ